MSVIRLQGKIINTIMFEASRELTILAPDFRAKVYRFLALCKEAKIPLFVVEARRTPQRQFFLWCKGRLLDKTMEKKYLGYIDPNIKGEPTASRVTWMLSSYHVSGNAIDVCPLKDGLIAWWTAPAAVWDKIYEIAQTCGIYSLYRLKGIDRPHLQNFDH